MKAICKKISDFLRVVFGYGIMVCLFVGGLTFFGYVIAIIIGGDTAVMICEFIYKKIIPTLWRGMKFYKDPAKLRERLDKFWSGVDL